MNPPFLTADSLRRAGAVHAFSLRTGGVSAPPFDSLNLGRSVGDDPASVDENLRRFLGATGVERDRLVTVNQVHGANVIVTGAVSSIAAIDADAVVASSGTAAGIRTADCLAILLFDPRTGMASAVHAGWRGTVDRIVLRAIDAMERLGARPNELLSAIGPGIGRCCFEVGPEVSARFSAEEVERTPGRRDRVDLVLANRRMLESRGVAVEEIPGCTSCRPDLFFSHRRDAGRTGRHLAVIASRE